MAHGQANIDNTFITPPWIERTAGPYQGTDGSGAEQVIAADQNVLLPVSNLSNKGGILLRYELCKTAHASGAATARLAYADPGQSLADAVTADDQWLSAAVDLSSAGAVATLDTWTRIPLTAPAAITSSKPGQVPAGSRLFWNMGATATTDLAGVLAKFTMQDYVTQ